MSVIPISGLNPEEQAVQDRSIQLLKSDPDRLIAEYRARFGVIVGTDLAREVFPDYADTTESRLKFAVAVQKAAAYLADQVFDQIVSEDNPGAAYFTARRDWGRKSSAITPDLVQGAGVVYDSNFNSEKSAFSKVETALSAGAVAQACWRRVRI